MHEARALAARQSIESLRDAWAQLQAPIPMQSYGWALACAESFTEGELRVVTAGNPISGIATFFQPDGHDALVPLGSDLYEPSDCRIKDEAGAATLAESICKLKPAIIIGDMFADSPMIPALRTACRWHRLMVVRPRNGHPFLPLGDDWLEPEAHLNAGRRSDLRRARRHAEKLGDCRSEMVTPTPESLPELLEEAFRVEAANWKGRQGSALATDAQVGGFYRRYAAAACEAGQLHLGFLRISGRAVAMQLAVEHGGRFWLLKMGFDQDYAKCAPGQLLMIESLRFAATRNCGIYEILGSSQPWNQVWTSQVRPAVSIRIFRSGIKGNIEAASEISRALLSRKS